MSFPIGKAANVAYFKPLNHVLHEAEGWPPKKMGTECTASRWATSAPFSEISWIWQLMWYSFRPWQDHRPSSISFKFTGCHEGGELSAWNHTRITPLVSQHGFCCRFARLRVQRIWIQIIFICTICFKGRIASECLFFITEKI